MTMAKLRRTLFVLAFCVVLTAGFAMSAAAEKYSPCGPGVLRPTL